MADDAGRLLDAGADKVSVNTAAVVNAGLIYDLADSLWKSMYSDCYRCGST